MSERTITRPQQLLRSFFSFGPEQFEMSDVLLPTFDIEALTRSNQDVQLITGASAAIAPNSGGSVSVAMPTVGSWLIHCISIESSGPATSGSWRMWASAFLDQPNWGRGLSYSIFDSLTTFTRAGGLVLRIARWFDVPLVLYNKNGLSDTIVGAAFNESGAVGNLIVQINALARPLGRLLGT